MNVRIDVQGSKENGYYAEIRVTRNSRLVEHCGHVTDNRHLRPGIANNCGKAVARAKNWVVCE